eukprot:CAMPEP_0185298624 /NCGR_PEP_ID=MMETSP1363-20130426/10683_1 /TAXON_ID=38817 /ORGANISM="Gephyrocapsa oceanica, Strain RCC1303" /LENGTH=63 /DNA_ID=CAMNT_0027895443 /DNA_START=175 /DNA_END=362 /DNA_ORIENTATION=-
MFWTSARPHAPTPQLESSSSSLIEERDERGTSRAKLFSLIRRGGSPTVQKPVLSPPPVGPGAA